MFQYMSSPEECSQVWRLFWVEFIQLVHTFPNVHISISTLNLKSQGSTVGVVFFDF